MRTVYACTFVNKEVSEDVYEGGISHHREATIHEKANIVAPTLKGLIEKVIKEYYLHEDAVSVSEDADEVTYFSISQMECDDNSEPSESDFQAWREGKVRLFCCDYDFTIERRIISPIRREEFEESGIKVSN